MKELNYRLIKEDYKNWIHWNVAQHDSKKMKIVSAVFFVIFAFLFLGRSFALAGNFKANAGPVLVLLMVSAAMYYTISPQNQERVIWKRSGLGRLEKAGRFPEVKLTILEKGITIEVAAENVRNAYSFKDILGILEIERLFLLETKDKTWQFVAKSAFGSQEEMQEFYAFMEERIEDAKAHPERYESGQAETPDAGSSDGSEEAADEAGDPV